ncbi:MAG: CpaD family pilus assembly lipoprotein, partial [Pseudomonadota bacterium]
LQVSSRQDMVISRDEIRSFMRAFAKNGHGRVVFTPPVDPADPSRAVALATEARAIAFEYGVDAHEIDFEPASPGAEAPLIMAFRRYVAVAPDCPSVDQIDLVDLNGNSESPGFGCAVHTNIAAMVADPADLLGGRALDPGDAARRRLQFELFRQGADTAADTGGVQAESTSGGG